MCEGNELADLENLVCTEQKTPIPRSNRRSTNTASNAGLALEGIVSCGFSAPNWEIVGTLREVLKIPQACQTPGLSNSTTTGFACEVGKCF